MEVIYVFQTSYHYPKLLFQVKSLESNYQIVRFSILCAAGTILKTKRLLQNERFILDTYCNINPIIYVWYFYSILQQPRMVFIIYTTYFYNMSLHYHIHSISLFFDGIFHTAKPLLQLQHLKTPHFLPLESLYILLPFR